MGINDLLLLGGLNVVQKGPEQHWSRATLREHLWRASWASPERPDVAGLIFVVAGLLKLGFITAFLSRPVMEGFVFGLAIFVTVSQLPQAVRPRKGDGDTIRQFAHVIANLGSASVTTLAVGAAPWPCCSGSNATCLACRAGWSS